MLKKLIRFVIIFSMLVSVSGRVMAEMMFNEEETKIIEKARLILECKKNRLELSEDEIKIVEKADLLLQRKKQGLSEFEKKIAEAAGILPEKRSFFVDVLAKCEYVFSKIACMVDSIMTIYIGVQDLRLGARGASLERYKHGLTSSQQQ
ncbi:MAG: hypothetical protein LBS61_00580 [Endomicrobium sp.]|nr:hypothetical protein [Endomicrobium sp.]